MKLEKLDKVAESLKKDFETPCNEIILPNKRISVSKEYFHPINESISSKKVGFIDGGNGEIIGGANFSVQLIKIYWSVYESNKRIKQKLDEFIILVRLRQENNVFYEVTFFDRKDAFVFEAFENGHLVKLSTIAERIRKIFEVNACNELLMDCKFIVKDGDLSINDYDKSYYEELIESCKEHNVILAGLSKTSTILCDNCLSAGVVLNKISKLPKWYYKNDNNILFVKLHQRSRHVFRLDVQEFNEELIELLAKNSIDLTFPGYPYGLIEVDKMARVEENELKRMKLYLLTKHEQELDPHLASIDAHDRLNVIK